LSRLFKQLNLKQTPSLLTSVSREMLTLRALHLLVELPKTIQLPKLTLNSAAECVQP
jgi:hypothetical protein